MRFVQSIAALLLVSLISVASMAQSGSSTTPEQRAKALTDSMKVKLPLEADQYDTVYAVNLKYAEKNESVMKGEGSQISKLKSLKSLNQERTKEMKGILTEEQFTTYQELQKEMRSEAKEAFKERRAARKQ